MTHFLISYTCPKSYANNRTGDPGTVVRQLKRIGATIIRLPVAPRTTIGCCVPDGVSVYQVKRAMKAALKPNRGRCCIGQLSDGGDVWVWPVKDSISSRALDEWDSMFSSKRRQQQKQEAEVH